MKRIRVTCAVIFSEGKVLCAQRSEEMSLPGLWEFPGGKVEDGESLETCLIREIEEELAISISLVGSLRPTEHSYNVGIVIRLLPFLCIWDSGEIELREHQDVKWQKKTDLKSLNWAPADLPIVEELIENWNKIQELLVDSTK